jgi:hypothetical protein
MREPEQTWFQVGGETACWAEKDSSWPAVNDIEQKYLTHQYKLFINNSSFIAHSSRAGLVGDRSWTRAMGSV